MALESGLSRGGTGLLTQAATKGAAPQTKRTGSARGSAPGAQMAIASARPRVAREPSHMRRIRLPPRRAERRSLSLAVIHSSRFRPATTR